MNLTSGKSLNVNEVSKLVGKSFEELSLEEMAQSQGGGEVVALSGPPCFLLTAGSALLLTFWQCKN
ncbi:mersacidin family lantibiotic [Amphibacillus sediminis]|uniref:mersacidin family lantibiotic n=1 Tax=Amphibacillus sediminis TaxID=360185 RepID=UPI000830F612|nr:lichenicidin A2 family type 2 lantibiotic [Amphibacillus sediminis]